jgi:hypothetical protein
VPEPVELTQCPYHDEELSRDSYLSPAFSSHGGYSSWAGNAWRQIAIALTMLGQVTSCVVDNSSLIPITEGLSVIRPELRSATLVTTPRRDALGLHRARTHQLKFPGLTDISRTRVCKA